MEKFKRKLQLFFIAFAGALLAMNTYANTTNNRETAINSGEVTPVQLSSQIINEQSQGQLPDLTQAAEKGVKAVVHIEVKVAGKSEFNSDNPFYDFFFGPNQPRNSIPRGFRQQPQLTTSSGSGVIIQPDGYIVTNNHVVDGAENVQVILDDNRKFTAKVIGRDANTDIALVKIDAKGLPSLGWGNSDALKLGEWVLAIGNPFNLTSTVTAGIVSAKSRSIGINAGKMPLESFIQTDAAVNPGNSGGALVSSKGDLVGINTAIASETGSYTGYSFAIPATIAKKVVEDLKKYGEVQRAILGVMIQTVTDSIAKAKQLEKVEGAYVRSTTEEGAARKAGIREGDVIVSVNGKKVETSSKLQEQIGEFSPGNEVTIGYIRNGSPKEVKVVLQNIKGGMSIVKETISDLGAEFGPISKKDRERLKIEEGIQILNLSPGKLKDLNIKIGYIITDINKKPVSSKEDIERILLQSANKKPILIEGVYPDGEFAYYIMKPTE